MIRFFLILNLFALALFLAGTSAVQAGEPVACGVPAEADMDTEPRDADYCNIHERRFAYREQAIKLKQQIQERAENYHAPKRAAHEQYIKDLKALNERRGTGMDENQDETADNMAAEQQAMGPFPPQMPQEQDAQVKMDPDLDGSIGQTGPKPE